MSPVKSFCFVGGGARALENLSDGGSERQIALLSSELARRGRTVTLVVPGGGIRKRIGGVEVIPGWPPGSGWPRGLRFWTSRLPAMGRLLSELQPDALYTRGFSLFAPSVASVSRRTGSTYLAALASDDDLRVRPGSRPSGFVHGAGYGPAARLFFITRALRRASLVLSQHGGQLEACRRMGLESLISRNAFVPPREAPARSDSFDAAWIGHLSAFKGFDRLVEFIMSGASRGRRIAIAGAIQGGSCLELLARVKEIPGVEYFGEVSHPNALSLIASSRVLLNTSPSEGFSNAFLEAWYLERPVVSLNSDPDGLLSGAEPLGSCAHGDLTALSAGLDLILADGDLRAGMGRRGRMHVEERHLLGPVVDSLEEAAGGSGIR